MKKIKNLLFIITIALVGFIGINNVKATENYGLWVNGEEFTSDKTTINCGEGTATFDKSTNTLTLNNATITKWYEKINYSEPEDATDYNDRIGIYYEAPYDDNYDYELYDLDYDYSDIYETLKIVLVGKNVMITDYYAIDIEHGNLVIDGTGSLDIQLNPEKDQYLYTTYSNSENIYVDGNLTIENVELNIQYNNFENDGSWNSDVMGYIYAVGESTIDSAKITATGPLENGIEIDEASLTITNSDIDLKATSFGEDYEYNNNTNGITATAIDIIGDSNINIEGFAIGMKVPEDRVLNIESGNISIKAEDVVFEGNVSLDEYAGKIIASWYPEGTNADAISKDKLEENPYYSFVKMGNIDTYKITNKSTNYLIDMPKETIEGTPIELYDWSDVYKINNVQILKTSDNTDVTSEVNYDSKNHKFIMPAYPVTVKVTLTKTYNANTKSLSTKLDKYNAIKVSWTKGENYNDYADGYYVYYKKSTDSSWTKIGWTAKTYYTKTDLTPGVKYNFKVVPFVKLYNANDKIINIESTKHRLANRYTLKKMNLPKVEKYNSSQVRVRWAKVEGATKYQIARSVYKSKNFKTIKTVGSGYIGYKIDTKANKTYYYKVRACNGTVCAPWSNYKSFRLQ